MWPIRLGLVLATIAHATAQQCYSMNGQVLDSRYQPCYPQAGSAGSACCMLNGTQNADQQNDLCLDSGLCMSTSGWYATFLYIDGCTDPTLKADGCPKLCSFMGNEYSYSLLQCEPGKFCCRAASDVTNCCDDNSTMISTTHIGNILLPGTTSAVNTTFNFTETTAANSSNITSSNSLNATCAANHTAAVGGAVGGVLGVGLIGGLVALAFALRSRKHYRDDLDGTRQKLMTIETEAASEKAKFQTQLEEQQRHAQDLLLNNGVNLPMHTSGLPQYPATNYPGTFQPGPIMQMWPQQFGVAAPVLQQSPPPAEIGHNPSRNFSELEGNDGDFRVEMIAEEAKRDR